MKSLKDKNLHLLTNLVETHKPDILCLQETKLQASMVDEYVDILPGYASYWSCSVEKKGYSGTAIFLNKNTINTKTTSGTAASGSGGESAAAVVEAPKKKQAKLNSFFKKTSAPETETPPQTAPPQSGESSQAPVDHIAQLVRVSYDFEDVEKKFSGEGRTITVELENLVVVACYVPNSDAKHITKQAGLTVRERQAHSELLGSEFQDSLRYFYPDARGQFTYWSQRTFARPVNKGIRLDYFVCSNNMYAANTSNTANTTSVESVTKSDTTTSTSSSSSSTSVTTTEAVHAVRRSVSVEDIPTPGVFDSYSLHSDTVGCSDHAPVVLVVKVV
eukprot:gene32149-39705_t